VKNNDEILKVLKSKNTENLYLGKVVGTKLDLYVDLDTCPHLLLCGMTRSGKTHSAMDIVSTAAKAYPGSKFFFIEGKGSSDWDDLSKKLSSLPVEKNNFSNILDVVWEEYEKRQEIQKDLTKNGNLCTSFGELRKSENLNRIFLVIDELSAVHTRELGASNVISTITRLASEASMYGIHIIATTQRVEQLPRGIMSNMTAKIIYPLPDGDLQYLECDKIPQSQFVEFAVQVNGLTDNAGNKNILCRRNSED
jgi:DNA segregation ATPase FtsK/SpoIIIE-like protein